MKKILKNVLVGAGALGLSLGGGLALVNRRWRARTAGLVTRLQGHALDSPPGRFSAAELEGLPAPVATYFRTVLRDGQPLIRRGWLTQQGDFLVRPTPDGWRPFTATQHIAVQPPGFVWDAHIRMAPGVAVRVRDGYVDGTGSMKASLLGLLSLADSEGTPGIDAGALHRYLAEAVWFPTALLPSQGVDWTPLDDASARATLTVRATTVSLDFRFGGDGLVESVFTPERARDVDGEAVPTPWQGRFLEYGERNGVRIPLSGEVEWLLPEGPQAYWRGRITAVSYE